MAPTLRRKSESVKPVKKNDEALYKLSDKLLCKFDDQLYDVIILEVKHVDVFEQERKDAISSKSGSDDEDEFPTLRTSSTDETDEGFPDKFAYFIHYKQWNSNWDEWVRSDLLMPISDESRERQKELKLSAKKDKVKNKYIGMGKKRRRNRKRTVLSQSQNGDSDDDTQTTLDGDDDGHFESSNIEEPDSQASTQPQNLPGDNEGDAQERNESEINSGKIERTSKEKQKDPGNDGVEKMRKNEHEHPTPHHSNDQAEAAHEGVAKSIIKIDSTTVNDVEPETLEVKKNETDALNSQKEDTNFAICSTHESKVETSDDQKLASGKTADLSISQNLSEVTGGEKPDLDPRGSSSESTVVSEDNSNDFCSDNLVLKEVELLKTAWCSQHYKQTETGNENVKDTSKESNALVVIKKKDSDVEGQNLFCGHSKSSMMGPRIDEKLAELRDHLICVETIGITLGTAFIKKLGSLFEMYSRGFPSNLSNELVTTKGRDASLGNTVCYVQLSKFIDFLESGEWRQQGTWADNLDVAAEIEDLEIVFEICHEYFDLTKKFLSSKISTTGGGSKVYSEMDLEA